MNQQFGNQVGQRAFFGGAGNMNQGATRMMGGAGSMGMMGGNMANQGNFGNQGGFGQMGMSQGVPQQPLNQIHQNSIFSGASQPDNMQVQRIHQASISGEEANPMRGAAFGGTSMGMMGGAGSTGMMSNMGGAGSTGMMSGMGGAGSMGMMSNMGGNMANQGNFGTGMSANFGNQGGFGQMGMSQGVPQQQLNQIHQNSIFNGASQPDNMQVQRIHQASISGEEMNPLSNAFGGGFGGSSMGMGMMGGQGQSQGFVNPSALNSVLNADAGIRDQQGPNRYSAAMYTGSNQFDNVNQSVLNQLTRSF